MEDTTKKPKEEKEKKRILIIEDRCVCCGAPVPEGRMICWSCERKMTS